MLQCCIVPGLGTVEELQWRAFGRGYPEENHEHEISGAKADRTNAIKPPFDL
jgi:hypothetical protein